VQLRGLRKSYGSARTGIVEAVKGIDLDIHAGQLFGFLGPNGAGKTTTMRILAGYLPATSAKVIAVDGHDVQRDSMAVRRAIGYLPEAVPLYPELRVDEMMRFQGRLHRMNRQELRGRIGDVLERVGVLDRRRQLVGTLSRGLKQRVGLAVALLPDPGVLILDEPTSGLDPIQRGEVRRLITELASDRTVLLSSHILAEIENVADRVIILHEERKVADGTQAELVHSLGGDGGHVLVEAMAAAEPTAMAELMRSLPGVERVDIGERVGIHTSFSVFGEGDLREDIGALAMTQTWALRELTWKRVTLEELFTRLVTGGLQIDGARESVAAAPQPTQQPTQQPTLQSTLPVNDGALPVSSSLPLGTPGAAQPKTIYSLNPFDRGASRDLSKPVSVEPTPTVDLADSKCDPPEVSGTPEQSNNPEEKDA